VSGAPCPIETYVVGDASPELEVVRVVPDQAYGPPPMMCEPGLDAQREALDELVQQSIDDVVADLPPDVRGIAERVDPAGGRQGADREVARDPPSRRGRAKGAAPRAAGLSDAA
jgi:hypothetical protein